MVFSLDWGLIKPSDSCTEFSGASVMDYQALFQEYIQRGTLLDKRLWCRRALESPKHLWSADNNAADNNSWKSLLFQTVNIDLKIDLFIDWSLTASTSVYLP